MSGAVIRRAARGRGAGGPGSAGLRRRAGGFAFLLAIAAGCASLPPPEARPPGPEEAALVRAAEDAVELGLPGADRRVGALLDRFPSSADGRRLRQILRAREVDAWIVYEEARRARRSAPEDPVAGYLLARAIPDRDEQARRFRRCLREDPSLFHGAFGLAAAELGRGRAAEVLSAAERARAIRPGGPSARGLLAAALAAGGAREEAASTWRALLTDEPGRPATALGAAAFFAARGETEEAAGALLAALRAHPGAAPLVRAMERLAGEVPLRESVLREAAALAGNSGAGLVLAASVERGLGRPGAGLAALDAAVRAGAPEELLREAIFEAAVLSGDYGRAAETWSGALPALARSEGNLLGGALAELTAALRGAAAEPGSPAFLARLARALRATGHADLAAATAASALAREPGNADHAALAGETAAWLRFLAALRERFAQVYARAARGEDGADLADLLAALGSDARRLLGRDVLGEMEELSVPFAGRILRSDRSAEWTGRGTLLVLGRRAGGPPEGKLLRLLALFRGRAAGTGAHDLAVGTGAGLTSFDERAGPRIGGFTLPGFVLLDAGVARYWAEEVRRAAGRGGGPAPGEAGESGGPPGATPEGERPPLWPVRPSQRGSLWFPGPALRDLARGIRGDGVDAALAQVLAHEEGHLADVARYHPILGNLPAVLWELLSRGFSARAIEEGLEERAEAHALARGPDPRFALFGTLSEAARAEGTAHRAAYRRILRRLVAEVLAHPGRYPGVDPRWNVVQQLGRLGDGELRRLLDAAADPR